MESASKQNPNRIGPVMGMSTDIPTSSDKVYRHVHGDEAITDLFIHGKVRNRSNAQGFTSKRWGDSVYWSQGQEGKFHQVPEGSHIIKAPHEVASERVVTKEDVTAIYSKDSDGVVQNRLEELRTKLGVQKSQ